MLCCVDSDMGNEIADILREMRPLCYGGRVDPRMRVVRSGLGRDPCAADGARASEQGSRSQHRGNDRNDRMFILVHQARGGLRLFLASLALHLMILQACNWLRFVVPAVLALEAHQRRRQGSAKGASPTFWREAWSRSEPFSPGRPVDALVDTASKLPSGAAFPRALSL